MPEAFRQTQKPLIVHTEASRAWGGQEMRVVLELREMAALGFRAALVARRGAPVAARAREAGLDVRELPDFHKLNPAAWLRMRRLLAELRPAVLNTHSSDDSWLAGPLARAAGVPLVLRTRHVSAPVSSTFSYRFPHEILACSGAIARGLAERGIDPGRVTVAPTGNDERRFRFSAEMRRRTRERFGLAGGDRLIGNVGFLRDYKGHAFILDTLAALTAAPEDGGPWRALFVGDGDLRGDLEARARRLGLSGRVIFAGHQERPEDFYHAFDVFFFASWAAEGVSQALVQALLNGLPVLACDLASNAEVLEGVAASRLVPYGDTAAATAALSALAAPPPPRRPRRRPRHDRPTRNHRRPLRPPCHDRTDSRGVRPLRHHAAVRGSGAGASPHFFIPHWSVLEYNSTYVGTGAIAVP